MLYKIGTNFNVNHKFLEITKAFVVEKCSKTHGKTQIWWNHVQLAYITEESFKLLHFACLKYFVVRFPNLEGLIVLDCQFIFLIPRIPGG